MFFYVNQAKCAFGSDFHAILYHIYVGTVPMLEVSVQMLFLVKALPTKATRPLAWPILRFGCLLRTEDVARRMERTVDGDFYLKKLKSICFKHKIKATVRLHTWYFSRIGSHLDCTILRTMRALSREHDILKTLGPGQGIRVRKQMSVTCEKPNCINQLPKNFRTVFIM